MKILVTGGAGFIAHHVIDYMLKKTDHEIVVLDRLDFSGNLNRLHEILDANKRNRVKFVFHDLRAELNPMVRSSLGKPDVILHLAAASHVDRAITHPLEFVHDNVVGTAHLLEYARQLDGLDTFLYFGTDEIFGVAPPGVAYKERDRYNSTNPYSASKAAAEEFCVAYENSFKLPVVITHCHDAQTRAWTEHGLRDVAQIALGDRVWVLKGNKELALEPVLEIVNTPYAGELIAFKSSKYDLLVTPNHRMLTRHREDLDFHIETAATVFNDTARNYIPTSGEWVGTHLDTIDIGKWLPKTAQHNTKKIQTKFDANYFLDLIGWYVSEGFCRRNGNGEVSISQKKYALACMQKDEIGFKAKTRGDGLVKYTKHSVTLARFLSKQFGATAFDKKLPSWIKGLSKANLQVLFNALMLGDGSYATNNLRYYTVSKQLAEDVAELGIKLGFSAAIKTRVTKNPAKTKTSKSFYVNFRKSIGGVDAQHKFKQQYTGNIWCLRTAAGNFFVERNGIISCSGNTMNVFGERQTPEKFIPLCIDKVRRGEKVFIHADATKTQAGSRFYIHAADVADALSFILTNKPASPSDYGHARCPKYNIVGKEEVDNLTLAKMIAAAQGKELIYEMVDFHSSRPGHDLRYALCGELMRSAGWEPRIALSERIAQVTHWYLKNDHWLYR